MAEFDINERYWQYIRRRKLMGLSVETIKLANVLELAQKKGSDKEYRRWIQRQPSCISGKFSEWVNGEGRCIAAHIRRAGEAGTAHKPEFSCVPVTDAEHRKMMHQHGDSSLRPPAWWDAQRIKYLKRWIYS